MCVCLCRCVGGGFDWLLHKFYILHCTVQCTMYIDNICADLLVLLDIYNSIYGVETIKSSSSCIDIWLRF